MHELDDPRDVDPAYILGAFDARRMIRLEGMPSHLARRMSRSYVSIQTQFPSFDRNVSYVTLSVLRKQAGDRTPFAHNFGWAVALNWYKHDQDSKGWLDSGVAGAVCLRGERVSTTELYDRFIQSITDEHEQIREVMAQASAGSVLKGPKSTVRSTLESALIHEHSHSLFGELELADHVLGTRNLQQIEAAIRSVIPSYVKNDHSFDRAHFDRQSLYRVPLVKQLADQGIGFPGFRDMDELTAEIMSLSWLGNSSPLVDAVRDVMRELCGYQSDVRIQRQERLFDVCKETLPSWLCSDWGVQHVEESLLAEAGGDSRFLLTTLSNRWFALGRSQIARIKPDEIEWAVPQAREIPQLMAQQLEMSTTTPSPVLEF